MSWASFAAVRGDYPVQCEADEGGMPDWAAAWAVPRASERSDMALFEIDESSGLPVWVQLRNRFVYLIKTGYYKPGDQLPSVRTLAVEAAINYNTVSKVYVNLEHDGYVESVRGRGVLVRDIGNLAADDVQSIADTEIESAIKRCLSLGMSIDEVMLKMIDVAHRVQADAAGKTSMRRGGYEKSQGKE